MLLPKPIFLISQLKSHDDADEEEIEEEELKSISNGN